MYSGPGGLLYADLSNRLIMLGLELMEILSLSIDFATTIISTHC